MINLDDYKEFRDDKEIIDIIVDYNEIEFLFKNNHLVELNKKLQELSKKHIVEQIVYNGINTIPPQNIYQNAVNCMKFLETLFNEKVTEKAIKNRR